MSLIPPIRLRPSAAERAAHVIGLLVAQFFLLVPLGGWALMLLLGVLYHEVSRSVPPLGFWICTALVLLAAFVKSAVAPNFPEGD